MVQSLFHVVNRKCLITSILSHRVIQTPMRSFINFSIFFITHVLALWPKLYGPQLKLPNIDRLIKNNFPCDLK